MEQGPGVSAPVPVPGPSFRRNAKNEFVYFVAKKLFTYLDASKQLTYHDSGSEFVILSEYNVGGGKPGAVPTGAYAVAASRVVL